MAKKPAPGGNLQELKTQLKNKDLGRLYIFHGEEVFLLHHYLEQMKKQLLDALTESFNFHRMNSETFDLQTFADAVENLPMMAEHTMVQVDEVDLFKLGESDRNKMAEILTDIPDYCTVVFTYETTPWKPDKRLKKLWEAIDGAGLIVEFAKQDQKDLAAWVTRHFMARDKRISTDLCLYLIDITGGTMTALSGEIDKICAYSGANEIRKTDIDAVTEPVLDAVVFQMTDMAQRRALRSGAGEIAAAAENAAGAAGDSGRGGQPLPPGQRRADAAGQREKRLRPAKALRHPGLSREKDHGGGQTVYAGILPPGGGAGAGNGL